MKILSDSKIALVHDDLVQWGGAERVLLALTEIFPQAPIFTSVYDSQNSLLGENFSNKKIITSFLQKIPNWQNLYKVLLPFYSIAFEQFDFSGYDLVISQTTRFAKSIITKPSTIHLCYCHTPPRFLWNFSGEKIAGYLKPYLNYLRIFDQITAERVDFWIAGSLNAQKRISSVYKKPSQIIYPFIDSERFKKFNPFDGGYFLVISRLNFYKRVDIAVRAFNQLKKPLKIIGTGPEEDNLKQLAGENIEFLGQVDEWTLDYLLSGCQGLIVTAEEDFGLTVLEAHSLGKPVIAFEAGGAKETVIKQTGCFFSQQNETSLILALQTLHDKGYNKKACIKEAERFSKQRFIRQLQEIINSL